ncbi:MAG: haloacid dehalogenase type II [Betaproteobacteria bacterium]|nr:haloacid dehalogenase type II [Betaproteobacteria bacterium]
MTAIETIKDNVRICMFDLYGTVVDIQAGLTRAVTPYLKAKGWAGEPARLVTWWRRAHFENSMIDALLHRTHLPYREVGRISLSYTLERAGVRHTQDEVRKLVAEIERLQPFPDVVAALERLQRKFRLVILSNGDPDMLEAIKPHLGIAFDRLISVAEAGSFKPHAATYRKAAEIMAARPEEILFVANHAFDCVGAKAAGMRAAFVDRRKRPFGDWPYQPDLVVGDFWELANRVG